MHSDNVSGADERPVRHIGTPIGVLANGHISAPLFGVLLGACVMAVGVLLYVRVRRPGPVPSPLATLPRVRVLVIGGVVAVVSVCSALVGRCSACRS